MILTTLGLLTGYYYCGFSIFALLAIANYSMVLYNSNNLEHNKDSIISIAVYLSILLLGWMNTMFYIFIGCVINLLIRSDDIIKIYDINTKKNKLKGIMLYYFEKICENNFIDFVVVSIKKINLKYYDDIVDKWVENKVQLILSVLEENQMFKKYKNDVTNYFINSNNEKPIKLNKLPNDIDNMQFTPLVLTQLNCLTQLNNLNQLTNELNLLNEMMPSPFNLQSKEDIEKELENILKQMM